MIMPFFVFEEVREVTILNKVVVIIIGIQRLGTADCGVQWW